VLTEKGRDFFPVVVAMFAWGNRYLSPKGKSLLMADRASARPDDTRPIRVIGASRFRGNDDRFNRAGRCTIRHQQRFPFRRKGICCPRRTSPPRPERSQALLGEHVFVPVRPLVIEPALEQALLGEVFQPARQNVRGNSKAALEFLKSRAALKCIAQNSECSTFAN